MEFYSSMRGMSPEDIAKKWKSSKACTINEKLIRKLAKITDPEDILNLS